MSEPTPDLTAIIAALSDPATFPHPAGEPVVVHTHASAVVLAGEHVYKLKKPVDLGFLDYSTLERRRRMCEAEVELNRRLAPDVYLGVVPITRARDGRGIVLGGEGEVLEYAVHMRRLPEEATLSSRVLRGPLQADLAARIGRTLAGFHATARRGPEVARWASFDCVERNALENLEALEARRDVVAPAVELLRLRLTLEAELGARRATIERRAAAGVPCETHGDLRLEHVYVQHDGSLVIVDCIEFSERFRCADPVSDTAFLAMDLQAHGAWGDAAALLEAYFAAGGDAQGRELVPLYIAYRSTVRAKVRALQAEATAIPTAQRERALQLARAHVQLAVGALAARGEQPCLLLVGGLPGTGKSLLSRRLAAEEGFVWLRADAIRKELAGLDPLASGRAQVRGGIYTPEWNDRTYGECLARAKELLFAGRRVLIDASFKEERRRLEFLDAARDWAVPVRFLVCESPAEVVRERLARREGDPSDADWTVYEHVRRTWDPPGERSAAVSAIVDTSGPPESTLATARAQLARAGLGRGAP